MNAADRLAAAEVVALEGPDYEPAGQRPFAQVDDEAAAQLCAAEDVASLNPAPLPLEFDGEIRPLLDNSYLIKDVLGRGGRFVVFGPPGCGKSFMVYDQGRRIARGLDWFGRRSKHGRVAYLPAEGQGGFRKRHAAWNMAHPSAEPDPFALIPTTVDLLDPAADLAKLRQTLDRIVDRLGGLDHLIIDTLSATFGGGDENGSDMAAYTANIDRLCGPYGCSCLIVHHSPLDATAKRPRGHGSLWGWADAVFMVTGDKDAPARRWHCIKQKDADPGPDLMFTLRQLEIGVDEDGDPVTSCVVEESDLEPAQVRGRRKLSAKEQIVFAALERTLVASGTFPPSDIPDNVLNRVRTGKVAIVSEWRAQALSALATPDTKPDTARKAFDRAKQQLQASETIGAWEQWAWLV